MRKIIFITGTSSGFGKLMAITLSKAGHTVIAGMRGITGKNKTVAKELSLLDNVDVVEIDVTNDASVSNTFELAVVTYGRIDVLINNAGVSGFGLLEAYSIDQVRAMFEINFYGVLRTYQAVLPFMRKANKGLIINITSGASGHTLPFMIPYLASKFAVESVTEGMQDELRQFNIENVSVQPGVYPTEMTNGSKAGLPPDRTEIIASYGDRATDDFNKLGSALFGKSAEYNMNPQTIADGMLFLVNMQDGTRPLRLPLDAAAEGTDKGFIQSRAEWKQEWAKAYGM